MSNSCGAVKFEDGLILHCEYFGTVDVMEPILYNTFDEMQANWRSGKWKRCSDILNHKQEDVLIASSYGRGFYWKGKACRICNVITDHHSPDYETEKSGLPDWFPNKEKFNF